MDSKHNITNWQGINAAISDFKKMSSQLFCMKEITNIEGVKRFTIVERWNAIISTGRQ